MKLATLIRSKSLVQLGTQMFLDLYPEIDNRLLDAHVVRAHSFWKVSGGLDTFQLVMLSPGWLRSQTDERVSQSVIEDDTGTQFLTTMTHDLQALFLENADNPETFPIPRVRVSET